MVTVDDLYDGLILKCNSMYNDDRELYQIKSLEDGILYSEYYNKEYTEYKADEILKYINSNVWFIYNDIKIHEIW